MKRYTSPLRRRIGSSNSSSDVTSIIEKIEKLAFDTANGIFAQIASYFNGSDYASFWRLNKRMNNKMRTFKQFQAEKIRILCSSLYKRLRTMHSIATDATMMQIPSQLILKNFRKYKSVTNYSDIVREFVRFRAEYFKDDTGAVIGFLDQLRPDELECVRSTEGFPVADLIDVEQFSEFLDRFLNLEEIKYLRSFKGGIELNKEFPTIPRSERIRALHLYVFNTTLLGFKSLFRQTPNLKSLTLGGEIGEISFNGLPNPKRLEYFELLSSRIDDNQGFNDELCQLFGCAPNLQSVALGNVNLTNALEGVLSHKSSGRPAKLTTLRLKGDISVSNVFLEQLSELSLETLEIPYKVQCDGEKKALDDISHKFPKSLKTLVISTDLDFYFGVVTFYRFQLQHKLQNIQYLYFERDEFLPKVDDLRYAACFVEKMFAQSDNFQGLVYCNLLADKELIKDFDEILLTNMLKALPRLNPETRRMIQSVIDSRADEDMLED